MYFDISLFDWLRDCPSSIFFWKSEWYTTHGKFDTIRGLSGKYRALFFIIGRVASFKVIPTWLNNTVPVMFPFLKTVLGLTFRDGLEYARRIIFNRRFVIESLSFEWFFEFWKQPKVTRGYVGTARRLSKQCDTVLTQTWLHIAHTLTCFFRPWFVWTLPLWKLLYHSFIRVLLIHSFLKAFCIIWIVSELVFPNWNQNLMQIRWSCFSVIFNNHKIRRTQK